MARPNAGEPRGILNLKAGAQKFQLSRKLPSPDLRPFVAHHWIVKWDLRGQEPYVQENLPHPTVHLVFEKNNTRIVGVTTGKFTVQLIDKGLVYGIKFRPGAFYPFIHSPVSGFTNRSLSLEEAFGIDHRPLERAVLALDDDEARIEIGENFLRERLPQPDDQIELINQVIDCIVDNRHITKVEQVVDQLGLNKRSLQRLFHLYVGVSPKWVIQRYRLHEAVEQMANGAVLDWARLALDLGYFDQAHFIKDFKMIVGQTPSEYTRQISDQSPNSRAKPG